jgi:hypothetical protein
VIRAAAAPGTITATFLGSVVAAGAVETGARTIAGIAVPYNVAGVVSSGDTVVFHPGSLDANARPIALRDHDRARPIGVVVATADGPEAMQATIRASRTRDGDDALVLAADGALPAFSVGANPTAYHYDDQGVLHVTAADWQELSLLTFGAYTAARVSTVTATQPGAPMEPDDDTTTDDQVDDQVDDTDDEQTDDGDPTVEVIVEAAGRVPVLAGAGRAARHPAAHRPAGGRHPYAGVGIADLSRVLLAASAGDPRAAQTARAVLASPGGHVSSINAALVDVTLVGTNNVGPQQRPGYQAELVDIVTHGSPLVEVIRQGDLQRGDYPTKTFNSWIKTPQVALQSGEKVEINSTPVQILPTSVPVQTWATGNDLSQQLLDFGAPSFVEDYIRAAGIDYAEVIELYAATALLAAAVPATTVAGDGFLAVLGKLFGGLDPTKVPAGGLFLAVSWDVWVSMVGIKTDDGPAFWNGTISFGDILPTANASGLSIIVSTSLPARTYLLGLRNAATWYDLPGTPFSLRAINVGQLGLDVGVYGYGALGVQYPGALVKTTVPLT